MSEKTTPSRSGRLGATWKRVLVGVLAFAAIAWGTLTFLFSGSTVACKELSDESGPSLRCEFFVGAAPIDVWEAFTLTDEPRPYYFDAVLQAEMRPGGRWRFVTDNRERLLAGGEILTLESPRRFAHSFAAADLDDPPSVIRVDVMPAQNGTRVRLTHEGFPGETTTYRRFRRAHPLALSALKSVIETGQLPLRARIYTLIFKPGMRLATVRAEPWE